MNKGDDCEQLARSAVALAKHSQLHDLTMCQARRLLEAWNNESVSMHWDETEKELVIKAILGLIGRFPSINVRFSITAA